MECEDEYDAEDHDRGVQAPPCHLVSPRTRSSRSVSEAVTPLVKLHKNARQADRLLSPMRFHTTRRQWTPTVTRRISHVPRLQSCFVSHIPVSTARTLLCAQSLRTQPPSQLHHCPLTSYARRRRAVSPRRLRSRRGDVRAPRPA